MCGILGSFAFNGREADAAALERQVAALAHRGPDDSTCWSGGAFAFGHRRLSIIDLSQGRQPMATPDGRLVVTFNGEIYNYIELRADLAARGYQFQTGSDTEVLLHGYREWGTGLPERLIGMFAFAIADRPARQLFLARDRFGEKPLLYCERGSSLLFSSELAPISALLGADRAFNAEALPSYLCLNYVAGDQTLMRGVRRLPPASWRLYGADGSARSGIYWEPPRDTAPTRPMADVIRDVDKLLDDAVRLALRSDVPVGMFLSGGIDSALISRVASEVGHLSHAFCLTFEEASYSEWERATLTAQQLGIPLTRVVLGPGAMTRFLQLVEHADDPLADSSALAVHTLAGEAARHVKVVLTGDGGDELFGGYLTYKATAWHNAVTSRLPRWLRRVMASAGRGLPTSEGKVSATYKLMRYLRAIDMPPAEAHFTWNGVWLPDEAADLVSDARVKRATRDVLHQLVQRHGLPSRPDLAALQRADVREYLPNDILAKADRMTMAHGLEARAPFLNPALADYALRLPAEFKLTRTGPTKRVLRELALARYGPHIAMAGKQGFSIPVHAWLRGGARGLVEDLLSPSSIARVPVLDPAAVGHAVDAHMSGRRSLGFEIWGLMVLVAWYRRHIESAPDPRRSDLPSRLSLEPLPA